MFELFERLQQFFICLFIYLFKEGCTNPGLRGINDVGINDVKGFKGLGYDLYAT